MIDWLVLIAAAWLAAHPVRLPAAIAPPVSAAYSPSTREVSNWRAEARAGLDLPLFGGFAFTRGGGPRGVSRCVRLNNYWCIKRAGWAGEIAADAEGHVAFSSAADGAFVAALLLRRYYVDFKRHSALDIVSRWAPAQCGGGGGVLARGLAPRGLRTTLRGRWLAAHGRGASGRAARGGAGVRRSTVAERPVPMLRTPTIAAGVSEIPLSAARLASLDTFSLPAPPRATPLKPGAVSGCASETQRINNYAARAVAGIARSVSDDLALFDEAGDPTPALALLMDNMAGVEIGPLKADPVLIDAAVEALGREIARRRSLEPVTQ